jgi:hypothetical protein
VYSKVDDANKNEKEVVIEKTRVVIMSFLVFYVKKEVLFYNSVLRYRRK